MLRLPQLIARRSRDLAQVFRRFPQNAASKANYWQRPLIGVALNSTDANTTTVNIDSRLNSNVKTLGRLLGDSIQRENPKAFEAVEHLRRLGREWRSEDGNPGAFNEMVDYVKELSNKELLVVARSFANFLALSNSAETHHRVRKLNDALIESNTNLGLWPKEDSCGGTLRRLVEGGHSAEAVFDALRSQQVEIVLTAHPTEVNRKTMIRFHGNIKKLLQAADSSKLSNFDRDRIEEQLMVQVMSIWNSDELNRKKPTPVDEAKVGLGIVSDVLWDAVPNFLRKLDNVAQQELKQPLPLDFAPIKIASWMGGDRDGNPNVTPEITLEVSMQSRVTAANLFLKDIETLRQQLSMLHCSEEFRALSGDAREPYRKVLEDVEERLRATVLWCQNEMGERATAANLAQSNPQVWSSPLSLVPVHCVRNARKGITVLFLCRSSQF